MKIVVNLSKKPECDYLYSRIKQTVTYAKISPKMVNPRDIAGEREEEGRGRRRNGEFREIWAQFKCFTDD